MEDWIYTVTYVVIKLPNVWSSLFTVKMAALGTFVSFSIKILKEKKLYLY